MAISGQENINIGLPNEAAGSDSLYTAFSKTQNNFSTLFSYGSPYTTFTSGAGISTNANSLAGTVTITNTGVTSIIAGTNVTIDSSNGAVTISAAGGGGGGGTVTSVNVVGAGPNPRITTPTAGPIISSGTIVLDLATTGVTAGTYTYPTLTVDDYGRINNISNGTSIGTVTSVAVAGGPGITVTGGPITSNGTITVVNSGVISLSAGAGIALSDSTGNITISSAQGIGTVTSVNIVSSTLDVTNSPIVTSGSIIIDLPDVISNNITFNGTISSLSVTSDTGLIVSGSEDLADAAAANLDVMASYFSTAAPETATLAAGVEGLIKTFMMVDDSGDMVITVTNAGWKSSGTGTITFDSIGDGCTLQYVNSKWYCIGNNGVTFG